MPTISRPRCPLPVLHTWPEATYSKGCISNTLLLMTSLYQQGLMAFLPHSGIGLLFYG